MAPPPAPFLTADARRKKGRRFTTAPSNMVGHSVNPAVPRCGEDTAHTAGGLTLCPEDPRGGLRYAGTKGKGEVRKGGIPSLAPGGKPRSVKHSPRVLQETPRAFKPTPRPAG